MQASRASAQVSQKIKQLEVDIKNLREENQAMLDKQELTNKSISDYISEMSTMLNSAELESAIALDYANTDSEEEEDYENANREQHLDEIDFEVDEVRPHAGTGGSSKLRSRPQYNQFG